MTAIQVSEDPVFILEVSIGTLRLELHIRQVVLQATAPLLHMHAPPTCNNIPLHYSYYRVFTCLVTGLNIWPKQWHRGSIDCCAKHCHVISDERGASTVPSVSYRRRGRARQRSDLPHKKINWIILTKVLKF